MPQLKQKIGVLCQNEHRPRYRVQKYVTAIHRRKLVKDLGGGRSSSEAPTGVGSPLTGGVRCGTPVKFFDFILRNVELLCILDSGAGLVQQL